LPPRPPQIPHVLTFELGAPGTWDFFGVNHYTTVYGTSGEDGPAPSISRDAGVITSQDPAWFSTGSPWLKVSLFTIPLLDLEALNPRVFPLGIHSAIMSCGSSVGIATAAGLATDEWDFESPVGSRMFTFPYRPDLLWGPLSPLSNGSWG
jgi:hypothetical protein